MLPLNQIFRLLLPLAAFVTGAAAFLSAQASPSFADFNPRFERFKLPGGEAANNVDCIAQDSVGFVWFGSQAGLHRYDGQHIITFHNDPLDSNSIASDQICWILIDSKGLLWLGHWGHGISVFDPATEKCIRYIHDPKNPDSPNGLSGNIVPMITEDREGYIWVATSGGLDRFDRQTKQFRGFRHQPGDPGSLSYNFVNALYVDNKGALWVGCGSPFDAKDTQGNNGGLNRYNPDGTFTRYLHIPKDPNSLADNRVRAIFEDSKGNFWVGTAGLGLHRMDRQTGKFTRLPFDRRHPSRLGSPVLQRTVSFIPDNYQISFIKEDRKGRLWIGAMEGGLNVYDPAIDKMRHFEEAKGASNSLQSKSLWHFCQTRDGVIWLSCGSGHWSVYRVKNESDLFPFYDAASLGIKNVTIPGVLKDPAGFVWLQTLGDFTGVLRLDPTDRRKVKRFPYSPAVVNSSFLDFFELGTDPQGNIWASTDKGLYKMNLREADGKTACFRPDTMLSPSITKGSPWPPFFDSKGNIWVATWGGGLYRFPAGVKKPELFLHNPGNPQSIGGDQVEKVFEDSKGNIWVHGGSIAIDEEHPLFFDRFEPDPNGGAGTFNHFVPRGEMGDPAKSLQDKKENFWFTAYPYGIRKLDPQSGAYRSFTVANNPWPTNGISDIVMGNDGNIWMLAKDVVIALDTASETSFNYTACHGIRTAAFSFVTGSCLAFDGEIFFGGEGGFHAFFPEEIHRRVNKNPPHLLITELKINGVRILPGKDNILHRPIWEVSEIRLPFDQNVFSFNVSCFDFNGPELSRLEFMLENYDRNWRNDLREGEASYVNVPPGKYVFSVRGANSMGVWDKKGISLRITILPPWWRSSWAYVLYATLFFGSVFTFYRFQLRRRLEHAETLRLQELDAVKSKLYTNITHEFRTPLTVILGMARQVLDNPKEHFRHGLDMIIRNGQNLLELVNQMLDLSKLESGKLALHLRQGDVVNFLKYLAESFHSLAESKDIKIHFLNDVEALAMDFDAERLQQVVSNLLSNAIKFTPERGHVYLTVGSRDDKSRQILLITVKDTGIGIPEEHLPHIFDRFYQVDDSQTRHGEGTGIGLALAKELVKLMEGEIAVKSTPGKGTEFTVTLPVQRMATEKLNGNNESLWEMGKRATPTPSPPPVANQSSDAKPLVLIAEDNADVVAYLASCLAADYRLAIAKDGQECEEMAFDMIPDLIVTDVMMPRKDGFEVCETLKNDERTSHIPIVLLTAKADVESKLEGLKHGADAYLMKPFHKEELLLRIKKLLELRQHLRQHYLSVAGLTVENSVQKDSPPVSTIEHAFVAKARAIVETHLDDLDFDVEYFCREMTLSHPQVHRKLSALTGLSANKFIRSIRLNKAKSLLIDPEMSITAVAFDSGFSDSSYFGKIFKQEFGLTPLEWREHNGDAGHKSNHST